MTLIINYNKLIGNKYYYVPTVISIKSSVASTIQISSYEDFLVFVISFVFIDMYCLPLALITSANNGAIEENCLE